MQAQWLLFYVTVAAYFGVGGYALIFGRAQHRWAFSIIALGLIMPAAAAAICQAARVSVGSVCISIDISTNVVICAGLLILAARYARDSWLLLALGLQACGLALDAYVFQDNEFAIHVAFPQVGNAIALSLLILLAWSTARSRVRLTGEGKAGATPPLAASQ